MQETETENFPKYKPNSFFKAAARILKILAGLKILIQQFLWYIFMLNIFK